MIEPPRSPVLFDRLPLTERTWVIRVLRDETVGGLLLVAAAVLALVWANSPWGDAYVALASHVVSIGPLHLDLTVQQWTADGLLAVFFFIAGVELKHELVIGSLSQPAKAAVPVAAALGGMLIPAGIYAAVNLAGDGSVGGWGIPMATDIAFALAVLAIAGRALPVALRAFLLTLAVVDDLGAIIVIALFYSKGFSLGWFAAAVAACVVYWLLQRARVRTPFVYVPLVLATWYFVHDSGIHATIAGVALGLLTRVRRDPGEEAAPTERMEHLLRPLSAGLCVPLFAFFSAGVDLRGEGLLGPLSTPVGVGVLVGLVLGKPIGVLGAAWLTARFTRARLSESLRWSDIAAIGLLAGIGFTVSLLIAELAFPAGSAQLTASKAAVLAASVVAALLASVALWLRRRSYAALYAAEERDDDGDGIPDVYQRDHG